MASRFAISWLERRSCSLSSARFQEQLVAVATESGLSRGQVLDLHAGYLCAMAEVALADGVVTCEERADLEGVASYLGLRSIEAPCVAPWLRRTI